MTPATSAAAALPMPSDWRKSTGLVGVAAIRSEPGGGVRVDLDQAAAGVIGSPAFVVVELAARVVNVQPCGALTAGARSTWRDRDGGLTFTARVASKRRTLGQWPAWAHAGGVELDLAGDQAGWAA
jgi:hypothetical protein